MTLKHARDPEGNPLPLNGDGPWPTDVLAPWTNVPFTLPCEDSWLQDSGDKDHAYLDAARALWEEHPDYMDFIDPDSPVSGLKAVERELSLHWWNAAIDKATTVLDLGCGIGRFALPLLDRGKDVIAVDGDLKSLQRLGWRAPGRPGRLDLHWSSVHQLPDVTVDLVLASEVLCYVPELDRALAAIRRCLAPDGRLLLSMEARWGWAASEDAPDGALDEAISGSGVVDLPGDRWVRTFERDELAATLERAGFDVQQIVPTHYVTDGPLEQVAPAVMELDALLEAESRLRKHPVWRPLNRLWTVTAR